MRNKFSEWVDAGIARFEYTPILPETSQIDPICREYNNIFAMALDTHMSMLEDGRRIITGHNVATQKWNYFINCSNWGGMNFKDAGYWTVNEFLHSRGLDGRQAVINGDIVWLVEEINIPANESLEETIAKVFYIVNEKTNRSYVVASKNEEDAKYITMESNEDLKVSVIEGVNINSNCSVILKDSDQVINNDK